jgi:hypothetical protein
VVSRRGNCGKTSVVSGTIDFRKAWPSSASDAKQVWESVRAGLEVSTTTIFTTSISPVSIRPSDNLSQFDNWIVFFLRSDYNGGQCRFSRQHSRIFWERDWQV